MICKPNLTTRLITSVKNFFNICAGPVSFPANNLKIEACFQSRHFSLRQLPKKECANCRFSFGVTVCLLCTLCTGSDPCRANIRCYLSTESTICGYFYNHLTTFSRNRLVRLYFAFCHIQCGWRHLLANVKVSVSKEFSRNNFTTCIINTTIGLTILPVDSK